MSEHIEQTAAPADAVPARIGLEDFIEAVTRGVTRALAAEDEVSGFAAASPRPVRPIWAGIWMPNPFPFEEYGGAGGGSYGTSGGGGFSVRGSAQ
ncbi:MAG: hypothetical protein ACRDJE_28215 [Dehalococcoidia bacterium]